MTAGLPRRPRLPSPRLAGASHSNWKVTVIAVVGAVILTGAVVYFLGSSADENLKRQGIFDSEVEIPPGKEFGYVLKVAFSTHYRFEVKSLDGPAVMAVGRVDDGDSEKMSPKDLAAAMENPTAVEAGKLKSQTGQMDPGRYLWVVANPSKDRVLHVRIKFG